MMRELIAVVCTLTALSCLLTYPQVLHLSTHVGEHYDALFSIWRLAWIAHQLPRDPAHLFDANIFHPEPNTLAYSDAILLPGLLGAPFIWAGVNPVLVHNALVLLSFVSSGAAMYALVRTLTGSPAAAVLGALVFSFEQYRFAHYSQLELLWTCWIPLAFLALHNVMKTRDIKVGVLLGLAVALQAWSCIYYAVFLVTALVVLGSLLSLGRPREELFALAGPLVAACAVVVTLCGPYARPYAQGRLTVGDRTYEEVLEWSPTLENFLGTTHEKWLYARPPGRLGHVEGVLFPGFAAVVLSAIAFLGKIGRRQIAYAVLLLSALDLSLGLNGFLFAPVRSMVLPYQGLRVPARMFVIVSACLAVLASYGVAKLLQRVAPRAEWLVVLILGGVILLESISVPLPLEAVPPPAGVYVWLAEQPATTILEWPLPRPNAMGVTRDPDYMYYSTFHWHRLINGYSGHYPLTYIELLHELRRFPTVESLEYLRRRKVRYVILHSEPAPALYADVVERLHGIQDVQFVMSDDRGAERITVFRVRGI